MTSAQIVETSVNVISNSPSQNYTHQDDRTSLNYDMTPGFKPFTIKSQVVKEAFYKEKTIDTKSCGTDLVTETDQQVEAFIIGALKEKFPSHR